MNEPWKITLLGALRAEREQQTITRFRTQKTGGLLAYLAYYLKRAHPREELAERFWPEADPEVGRANLRTALTSLRRQLEPPGSTQGVPAGAVLIADRLNVRLNPQAVTVDTAQFEVALKSAEWLTEDYGRIGALTQAVEQYGGELLPALYDEWVLTERERLGQAYLGALHQLTRLLEKTGELSRALDFARRAVAADPLSEESHQDLMRLLAANGQSAAALRQFEELKRILREELGDAPSAATRALAEHIQSQPQSLRNQPQSLHASPPATASSSPAPDALPARALPTGTVTFLLTDIEGSTARWERTGEDFAMALSLHDALLREAFQKHGGHEVKAMGDGFLVAFARAEEALACAIAGQRALAAQLWPEKTGPLRVRMALHTGDVELEKDDYHGLVLHRASRIRSAAHGGQILCSEATAALLRRDVGSDTQLVDLGLHQLRDVPAPERLFQVEYPGMEPRHFPPLRTEAIHTARLPLQFTRFFGREEEVATLTEQLRAPEARLVTLTGPGGSGKTRLAIETARRLGDTFGGVIYFASLADLPEARHIPDALLGALGLERLPSADALAQIARFLEGRRSLLVLDNLEHLVEEGAAIVHELLARIPSLTCLVTSRQRLEIAAEREFTVLPLPVPSSTPGLPGTPERLMEVASVQLFADRARAALPDFAVTPGNATSVAALCARLEGMPLAIELAAARASLLTPAQMLRQLDVGLDFLVSRRRDIAPRHRTLRAAITWSYEKLSPELQRFFASLSVFRGGWTLEAAEAICQEPGTAWAALDWLTELQACSLILAIPGPETGTHSGGYFDRAMRYRMLETLREFAEEQLSPEEETLLRRRHADWCAALAEEASTQLSGPEQGQWLDRLEAEHDNLRAALAWLLENDRDAALRLANALFDFWEVRGYFTEGRGWLERALLASQGTSLLRAEAAQKAGVLAVYQGDFAPGRSLLEESVRMYQLLGNKPGLAFSLISLAHGFSIERDYPLARALCEEALAISRELGDWQGAQQLLLSLSRIYLYECNFASARAYAEEGLRLSRRLGDRRFIASFLKRQGVAELAQGHPALARPLLEDSLTLAAELGDVFTMGNALWALALVALGQGEYAAARSFLKRAVAVMRDSGSQWGLYNVEVAAMLAAAQGEPRRAARLLGAAAALRQAHGFPLVAVDQVLYEPYVARARAALGEEAFVREQRAGAVLSLEQAVAEAFGDEEEVPSGSGPCP